jgi:hypothetical protein
MEPYYTDAFLTCSHRAHVRQNGSILARPLPFWLLRVAWVTLPLTAGPAASAAVRDWSDATRVVAEVLLWGAWAIGLLATLAPRPETLTALRVVAPAFAVAAVLAVLGGGPSALAATGAILATLVCSVLASGHDIAIASANAAAYGDERRYPLRTPPALFLGPLPLARLLVAGAFVAGPLLLADGDIVAGIVAVVVGAAVVYVLSRSLLGLSRRWAVLVPAGFVVVDPFTLADPHLFLREHVRWIAPVTAAPAPGDVADLRLGATAGSVAVHFDEPADIVRTTRSRRGSATVRTGEICVAVVRHAEMLRLAAERRLPVRV